MANDRERKSTCAVCGKTHRYPFPAFGRRDAGPYPHLDLRLPMIDRDAMGRLVQKCPDCGYTAKYLSKPTQVTREYLDSEEYRNCGGMCFGESLAERFYQQHLILLRDRKFSEAVFALLHAAWLCDDKEEAENAAACRRAAADLLEREILPGERIDVYELLYADLLRRSGQFQKLIDQYPDFQPETEDYRRLIEFEYALAEKQDDGCYTIKAALQFHAEER